MSCSANKNFRKTKILGNLFLSFLHLTRFAITTSYPSHSKLYIMEQARDFNPQSDMDHFFHHQQSEHPLDEFDVDDQTTLEESEGSTLLDAEVPSLAHESTLESSVRSLRERFLCTHPMAEKVKRRQAKVWTHELFWWRFGCIDVDQITGSI